MGGSDGKGGFLAEQRLGSSKTLGGFRAAGGTESREQDERWNWRGFQTGGRWNPGKCNAKFSLKQRPKFPKMPWRNVNHSFNRRKIDYFASKLSTITGLPKAQLVFGKCLRQLPFSLMFRLPLDYLLGVRALVVLFWAPG